MLDLLEVSSKFPNISVQQCLTLVTELCSLLHQTWATWLYYVLYKGENMKRWRGAVFCLLLILYIPKFKGCFLAKQANIHIHTHKHTYIHYITHLLFELSFSLMFTVYSLLLCWWIFDFIAFYTLSRFLVVNFFLIFN